MIKRKECFISGGEFAKDAYNKLKDVVNIVGCVYFEEEKKEELSNPKAVSFEDYLKKVNATIIICDKEYYLYADKLLEADVEEYYVYLDGFLYYTNQNEVMHPIELFSYKTLNRTEDQVSALFICKKPTKRIIEIVNNLSKRNHNAVLLMLQRNVELQIDKDILYYEFTSMNGIAEFVKKTGFDIIHCMEECSLICNVVFGCDVQIVYDFYDTKDPLRLQDTDIEVLNRAVYIRSNCIVCRTERQREIIEKKYGLNGEKSFIVGEKGEEVLLEYYSNYKTKGGINE